MSQQDEVQLGVDELTDRQVIITILKRQDAHNTWMENFMTNLSPEFTDLTAAVTAMLSAFSTDTSTLSADVAQIGTLTQSLADETSKENADQTVIADLNAQIATLTTTTAAQAAAAEAAAAALKAALPAAVVTPPPAAVFSFIGTDPTTIDATAWTVAGTDATGANVYSFSGDVTTVDATQWTAYTGVVTPAAAPAGPVNPVTGQATA